MNVYDFDGTIFAGDCSVGFALWCTLRHPKLWFTYLPKALSSLIRYKCGKIKFIELATNAFAYIPKIDDFDYQVEQYWNKNESKITKWYLAQKKEDDLIISASPTCVIGPIAKRLGVDFVASEYDCDLGVFTSNLMYAREKSLYIIEHDFPVIENFYSDSLADTPLALCAEKAHLVSDNASKVSDWPKLDTLTKEKVKKKIDTGWTIHIVE